jgi:glycosyltransferase involved in cell wall biosynthesis
LPPRSFGYSPGMLGEMLRKDADIVHCHGIWMFPSVACTAWAMVSKRPYLISTHGMLDPWAIKNSRWKKVPAGWLYEGSHLRSAACMRALGISEAQSIRHYGLSNPICIVPNGIDLQNILPVDNHADRELKTLLYLGRIHPKKGLQNLLLAWRLLQRRNRQDAKRWELAIVGWDQSGHEDRLRALAHDLGLSQSVRFLGPRFGPDKAASYSSAEAFILPSFSEGLPMVVLEAWAYALPVIMTPYCNLPEGFENDAAIKIDPEISSIVHSLETLVSMSNAERQAMGSKGRKLVEEHFAWPKIGKEMSLVYEWIVGDGPPPACVVTD